ncbi:hypothetical protein LNKW23_48360 [Paralimibaculum aggregatum]|uniref:Uncharacterized protein n=1 Tax=Paralimibaculum aggregatum TaxID=3036245 RepID=A0ABQ6LU37_9RHOB|nr:hypothetical protein LNKW23_48360 [Limibaculum sp. NKW23]
MNALACCRGAGCSPILRGQKVAPHRPTGFCGGSVATEATGETAGHGEDGAGHPPALLALVRLLARDAVRQALAEAPAEAGSPDEEDPD